MSIKKSKIARYVVILMTLAAVSRVPEAKAYSFHMPGVSVAQLCGIGAAVCIAGAALVYGFGSRFWPKFVDPVSIDIYNKFLFIAAERGSLANAKMCVEQHHANVSMVSDTYQRTPLHVAAVNGNFVMAEYLVSQGADKNKQDECGKKPIDYAPGDKKWEKLLSTQSQPKPKVRVTE